MQGASHYDGDYYSSDDRLRRVFGPRHAVINAVYEQFKVVYAVFFLFFCF